MIVIGVTITATEESALPELMSDLIPRASAATADVQFTPVEPRPAVSIVAPEQTDPRPIAASPAIDPGAVLVSTAGAVPPALLNDRPEQSIPPAPAAEPLHTASPAAPVASPAAPVAPPAAAAAAHTPPAAAHTPPAAIAADHTAQEPADVGPGSSAEHAATGTGPPEFVSAPGHAGKPDQPGPPPGATFRAHDNRSANAAQSASEQLPAIANREGSRSSLGSPVASPPGRPDVNDQPPGRPGHAPVVEDANLPPQTRPHGGGAA